MFKNACAWSAVVVCAFLAPSLTVTSPAMAGGNPACGPGAGDCCIPDDTPGCNDVDCCNAVCAVDPFCCDFAWDTVCADAAQGNPLCNQGTCGGGCGCGDPGSGSCCDADGTPCCDDLGCCNLVCGIDPFCCDVAWDTLCAGEAQDLCAVCSLPCPWDCENGDGTVDVVDFLALLIQWPGPGACDLDGGGIGVSDFLKLLDNWGPCP